MYDSVYSSSHLWEWKTIPGYIGSPNQVVNQISKSPAAGTTPV
jgi:hypothetical protein